MTTRINITVDQSGLLNQVANQTRANHEALVIQQEQKRVEDAAVIKLTEKRRSLGQNVKTGEPLPIATPTRSGYGDINGNNRIGQDPAANRRLEGDTYLYWFPTPPDIQIEYLYLEPQLPRGPYTSHFVYSTIYRGRRPSPPFSFNFGFSNYGHTSGYSYLPSGGPFGGPAILLKSTSVPAEEFGQTGAVGFQVARDTRPIGGSPVTEPSTALGITKSFSEFTTELEFAVNSPGVGGVISYYVTDIVRISDKPDLNFLEVNYEIFDSSPTSILLRLRASVRNQQTNASTIYASTEDPIDPSLFVFNDINTWNRFTLVYTRTALFFFVSGVLAKTVTYPFPVDIELDPATAAKSNSLVFGNREAKDVKFSASSFTTKALYRADYTPGPLVR